MNYLSVFVPFILFIMCRNGLVLSTDDRFIKRYAVMKMYESCFGPDVVKEVRKEMKIATAKCSGAMPTTAFSTKTTFNAHHRKPVTFVAATNKHQQQQQQHHHHQQAQADNLYSSEHLKSNPSTNVDLNKLQQAILAGFNKQMQNTYPNNIPMGTGAAFGHIRPSWAYTYPGNDFSYSHMNNVAANPSSGPAFAAPFMNYHGNPFYQSVLFTPFIGSARSSRELDIKGQLESLAVRVSGRMRNISCVMQELGYLNKNMEPDYDHIISRIKKLPVAEEFKTEIAEGIEYCKQFSLCVPENKKDKYAREMVKPMFFFKCYKHKKMEACILKDIRERYSSEDIDDNFISMDRNDRSNRDLNSKEMTELALYEFLYGTENNDDSDEFF